MKKAHKNYSYSSTLEKKTLKRSNLLLLKCANLVYILNNHLVYLTLTIMNEKNKNLVMKFTNSIAASW